MRHAIRPTKTRHNQPKKRGTTLWHVMLVGHRVKGRFVRVNATGVLQDGEIRQNEQRIRSIKPQAAARRFIKKRLPVVAVLQDDGANDLSDAFGGYHSWMGVYRKVSEANRYRRGRMRNMRSGMKADIGGTYGVKVVYG